MVEQQISGLGGSLQVSALWQASAHVAIICHPHPLFGGTMDNKVVTSMARFFKQNGMSVIRFNFRGVGESTGQHDHAVGEIDDALSVLTWALTQTDARHLHIAGFSFGAYIAAAVASRFNQGQVSAELTQFMLQKTYLIAPPVHHNPMSELALTADTLVVVGDQDEVVPPQQMIDWAQQLGLKLAVIDDCSHFFHGHLTDLNAQLAQYLGR